MLIHDEAAYSELYRAILQKIISGEYAPGQRLVEEDLARSYGVSRTPIREILFAFEKDGLVERIRNRGAKVVSFTAGDVEELFDIRKALEVHCVPNAIRTVKLSQWLELEHRLAAVTDPSSPQWRETHAKVDLELHHLIVRNSGNRRLIAYVNQLALLIESLQLASFWNEEHVQETGVQHLAIIRALIEQEAERAQRLLAEHIEYGKRNAIELFLRNVKEEAAAPVPA